MRAALCVVLVASCGFRPSASPTGDAATTTPDAHDAHDARIGSDAVAGSDATTNGGFDPSVCPSAYVAYAGASPTSHYRVQPEGTVQPWDVAEAMCEADHNAATTPHLVVFDTEAERAAIIDDVAASIDDNYTWTGNYTRGSGDPWLAVTGGAMTDTTGWLGGSAAYNANTSPPNGPNGASLEMLDQPPAVYVSAPFDYYLNFICECDGQTLVEP